MNQEIVKQWFEFCQRLKENSISLTSQDPELRASAFDQVARFQRYRKPQSESELEELIKKGERLVEAWREDSLPYANHPNHEILIAPTDTIADQTARADTNH